MTEQEKKIRIEELIREFDQIFTSAGSYDQSAGTANTEVQQNFEEWRKGSLRILKGVYKPASTEVDCFVELKDEDCPPKDYRQYLVELLEDFH